MQALSSFSRLSSLDLSLCSRVTDKALARLARLPALSSLDLGSCEAVGEAGLLALAAAPTLRTLLLPGCAEAERGRAVPASRGWGLG